MVKAFRNEEDLILSLDVVMYIIVVVSSECMRAYCRADVHF